VRAEGVEPSRAFASPTDFHATSAFAAALGVRGLDYPFTVRTESGGGAARLVSTPSRPEAFRSGLGSGSPLQGSPTLGSSASPVSRRALKFFSSPLRLPVPPHPRGRSSDAVHDRATALSGRTLSRSSDTLCVVGRSWLFRCQRRQPLRAIAYTAYYVQSIQFVRMFWGFVTLDWSNT